MARELGTLNLVLGLFNTLLRPILVLLTLPVMFAVAAVPLKILMPVLSSGFLGIGQVRLRNTAGPLAASYGRTGLRNICRVYQSVLRSDVQSTVTSWRIPSTSCAYHNGKVSLSPLVKTKPSFSRSFLILTLISSWMAARLAE